MDRIDGRSRLFVFYLVPNFTLLALSSAIEVLRLANAVVGEDAYSWRLVSANGDKVTASCDLTLDVDSSIAEERRLLSDAQRPFMAIVCGGLHIEDHVNRAAEAWLRECRQRAVAIASLCNGAHMLACAGLLEDRRCTIHWENFPGFAERFRSTSVSMVLYDVDGGVHTCAGGTASIDMMLSVIKHDYGEAVVTGVCERALVDRVRQPTDRQRRPFATRVGRINPSVALLIEKMEDNLIEPLDVEQLAAAVKLSRRQIERLFQSEMGSSPARYYMKLRLERARLLLLQTTIPIVEVAVASGFVSASHFSKCYREVYDCSPHATRNLKVVTPAPWPVGTWPEMPNQRHSGALIDRAA
ncbi:GlxA family transcriptional regulator [Mesorhizobium denitrificans]|uniref:GlxA family transcriptional regulator n=1 Tax=Mesorhizobium denitrificans TaxID=2294114 RepID=A0A371X9G8_9HYPH|nr:GlxA family transcriptional regulator [Mesorhizobium denitrificans]RFC65885.1 GlxA family transcriptional regulator [Mesorhizobium denitrificans]